MSVRRTGSPISTAECSLPPTAYTLRPKGVQCAMKAATSSTPSAIKAPSEIDMDSPNVQRHWARSE